jgi:hypothetical protein
MTDQERVQELLNRSRLPDPCTLVFSVPREAPAPVNEQGWAWSVEQWIYLARKQGHTVTRADSGTGHGLPTWCGDINIDGLTYQVHRGPRKRILALYVENGAEAGRFELQESTWVEPVPPQPLPNTCPWCTHGPPRALRHAAEDQLGDVYVIAAGENPDGTGRALTIQTGDDETNQANPYCITLEPAHASHYGGTTNYKITKEKLIIQLTPVAAQKLQVDPTLTFDLALDHQQLATLRTGLERTLSPHRPAST